MIVRRQYIDGPGGGQIHLAEAGQGQSILLLHQTPRSWDEFHEVMLALASGYHPSAMDLPGMGSSDLVGSEASIERYADAAAAVIQHFGGAPMTVCGHHTGGVVAVALAANRPELVSSLVLSSTPMIDAPERQRRLGKVPIDSAESCRTGEYLLALWQQRSPYYPAETAYLHRFMCDALRTASPAAGHHAVSTYRMEAAVPKVRCPVLVVEHQRDPFASLHTARLVAALSGARLERIPEGQVALEVTAREFSKIISHWLDSQTAAAVALKQ